MDFKNQKDMFIYVRLHSDHKSEVSGTPIYSPRPVNFAHILGKGMHKKYMLDPNNIIIVANEQEHHGIDKLANGNKYIIEQELKKGNKITVDFLLNLQPKKQ